jgi:predicted unusual protein kinase regulating ubiquinone biosynthesis (AarF/ABC1/UbiB family)
MALAKRDLPQLGPAPIDSTTAIIVPEVTKAAIPSSQNRSRFDPSLDIKGHGLRGYWRALQIIWTFALYHIFVFAYHRGWFIGGKDESEEKHLQWQGEWLSRQLLHLGPTFIKIGQSISTRADLLPLAYIKELSKLQDQVPAFPHEVAMATIER